MAGNRLFPSIKVTEEKGRWEGIAGLEMASILKGDLLLQSTGIRQETTQYSYRLDPRRQQDQREAMVAALAGGPAQGVLELSITCLPNLANRPQSHLWISLFIRASGPTQETLKEEILSRYIALMPLLVAHFPEVDFTPITDQTKLEERSFPFHPNHATSVHRREAGVLLSSPVDWLTTEARNETPHTQGEGTWVKHRFPWTPSLDDWNRLLNTMVGQWDPLTILIRLRPTRPIPKTLDRLRNTIRLCERYLSRTEGHQVTLQRQAASIRDVSLESMTELQARSYDLGVFVMAPCQIDLSLVHVLGRAITGRGEIAEKDNLFKAGFTHTEVALEKALTFDFFPEKDPFSVSEAACAFRLPSPPLEDCPGLPVRRSRTSMAMLPIAYDQPERDQGLDLLVNEHRGYVQCVRLSQEDRFHHTFILGQTGTGKSTLMESLVLADIHAGRGLAVIDPHGDLVESILGKIPPERVEDVIYFNLLDSERPVGFNVLQWSTIEERDLIIDELYLSLDQLYDLKETGGPIFETNFRGMMKLLMGDRLLQGSAHTPDHHNKAFCGTLLEFILCYQNSSFREWLSERIEDPQVRDFLQELEGIRGGDARIENLSPYITSKFNRFVHDSRLKAIVGQSRTAFDFQSIMDQEKILLVNLGKGRFGATVSGLLANQIVARFKLAAMKRGDLPPSRRIPFFLYCDEAHNLPAENFMELLSEARKFKLGLVLATQFTAQLGEAARGRNNLLSAILGNVGCILTFRLGLEDAERLAAVVQPGFSPLDITGLPNWNG